MCCAAYANNRESSIRTPLLPAASHCCCVIEHRLSDEMGEDKPLSETSFFLAMKLARGTVSVVDANGMSWTRIWCGGLMANYSLCRMNHTAAMTNYSLCSLLVWCVLTALLTARC